MRNMIVVMFAMMATGCSAPVVDQARVVEVFVEGALVLSEPSSPAPVAPQSPCPRCDDTKTVLEGKKLVRCPECQ